MELTKEITIEELEATIKCFNKDKSLRPDGWVIEFYSDFFDTLGEDLIKFIEHSRTSGKIPESFTSTFIALIPKLTTLPPLMTTDLYLYVTASIRSWQRLL